MRAGVARPSRFAEGRAPVAGSPAMAGALDGVRVLELGIWVAVPSAAAVLADWGARVVKIEPPEGDPRRGLAATGLVPYQPDVNPAFQLDNRGKRSVTLDLRRPEGPRGGTRAGAAERRVPDQPPAPEARPARHGLRDAPARASTPRLRRPHRLRHRGPGARARGLRLCRLLGPGGDHGLARRARGAAAHAAPGHGRSHDGA